MKIFFSVVFFAIGRHFFRRKEQKLRGKMPRSRKLKFLLRHGFHPYADLYVDAFKQAELYLILARFAQG